MTIPFFLALLFVCIVLVNLGVFHSAIKTGKSRIKAYRQMLAASLLMAGWLGLTAWAMDQPFYKNFDLIPPPVPRVILPGVIVTLAIAYSKFGRQLAAGLSFSALVGFHAFRIPLELFLHSFYEEGIVPVQMTYLSQNWDILTGVTGVLVALLAAFGKVTRFGLYVWNVFGLILLVNVVSIALRTVPGRWNSTATALNLLPFHLPHVWITLFVLLALLGHLVIFRKLRSEVR